MEIASKYDPTKTEDKWYKYWLDNEFFRSTPDERESYTIVIPPPNVTGVLHMGHMLNNTLQDVLVRRARMLGKNALWVPGTDHASIATEAKVVAKLKDEGIEKSSLTREKFLEHAWEWKEKHGGIILEQLKKLGASCDWERTRFTMDPDYYNSVIDVFIDLYNKGKIYRGVRMINWDPSAQTAVSDEEVYYKEEQSKLYHVKYKVDGADDEWVTIATTRPETILGDSAVAFNPSDERYTHLKGKKVIIPLVNRVVPLIEDEYVDMEFGTGCLKITPAHDINDYEIGNRHNLEVIDIFNDNGTLNKKAKFFVGTDRAEARKLVTEKLQELGQVVKIEDYNNKVGYSERTHVPIEPKLSMQWFLSMKELAQPALENVMNDVVQLHPAMFKNTYRHWMENVKDWCVSRQLWWGHRIPAYYIKGTNEFVVAKTIEEAVELAKEKTGDQSILEKDLEQEGDVMDTWFSSWLWPFGVFNGIDKLDSEELKYYYPTNDLVTAPEILFFWVARMIIAGYEYMGEKPFKNVYLTGIVRDKQGRKMSKSLGNSPDPLDLIKKYGADGVRVGMLLCSPAGNDLLFDEGLPEQGRNFGNKIWNAFRLVKNWEKDESIEQPTHSKDAVNWFNERLQQAIAQIDEAYGRFKISEALMLVYRLFWDDFCSWYLEIIKPAYQQPIDIATLEATNNFFDKLLKVLHPFMPFITEEIYHLLAKRENGESIMVSDMPKSKGFDKVVVQRFEEVKEVITKVRSIRKEKNIPLKESLDLFVKPSAKSQKHDLGEVLIKMCGLSTIQQTESKPEDAISFLVSTTEYFVPVGNLVDKEEEIEKIETELEYTKGFLKSVDKKLSNERFVQGAPEKVVDMERKKKADAEIKIKALEEQLMQLKK